MITGMELRAQHYYRTAMFRNTPAKQPEYKLLKARQASKMQEGFLQTEQQLRGNVQTFNRVVLQPRLEERPKLSHYDEGKLRLQARQQAAWDNLAALQKEQDTAAKLRERQSFAKYGTKILADLKKQKQEEEANRSLMRFMLNAGRHTQVQQKWQREEQEHQRELKHHQAREADRRLFQKEQKLKAAKDKQDSIDRNNVNRSIAAAQRARLQAEKRDHRDAANCCSLFQQTAKAENDRKPQIHQTVNRLASFRKEQEIAEILSYGESNYVSAGKGEPKYRLPEQPKRGRRLRPMQIPINQGPNSAHYMQLPLPDVQQAFSRRLEESNYVSAGKGEPKYRLPEQPKRGRRLRPMQILINQGPNSTCYVQLPRPDDRQAFSHSLKGSNCGSAGKGEPKYRLPLQPRPPPPRWR